MSEIEEKEMYLGVRLSEEEAFRFKQIKKHLGLSQNSEILRLIIKERFNKLPAYMKIKEKEEKCQTVKK